MPLKIPTFYQVITYVLFLYGGIRSLWPFGGCNKAWIPEYNCVHKLLPAELFILNSLSYHLLVALLSAPQFGSFCNCIICLIGMQLLGIDHRQWLADWFAFGHYVSVAVLAWFMVLEWLGCVGQYHDWDCPCFQKSACLQLQGSSPLLRSCVWPPPHLRDNTSSYCQLVSDFSLARTFQFMIGTLKN